MERAESSWLSLPNAITLVRLALTPLVAFAIFDGRWRDALLLFGVAGVSDALDGYLARRLGMRSELGAFLDPLADKALLVTIYVTLAIVGAAPVWLAALVVGRDLFIIGTIGVLWALGKRFPFRPLFISKANTAAQIVYAGAALSMLTFGWTSGWADEAGAIAVGALTILSFAAYLVQWSRGEGAGAA